ncbi:MAG: hypothetical protein PHN89_05595, partial [Candidatus Pacebacteria bacterium]|nr:hypothetical protein [Candidatus Paceibacterota bacterium]
DVYYPQLPPERHHAFSNEIAEIDNNHGRIFGPYRYREKYVYVAAFSRENIDCIIRPKMTAESASI